MAATVTPGTLRAYRPYWKRVVEQWGDRRLDEPTPSEVKQLAVHVKANAVPRRNSRGGSHAAENLISALRCLYQRAVDDGLIDEKDNPARKVAKPRRLPSTRQALTDTELAQINRVAATGDDPELDALIVRLHTETACRRAGALAIRPRDLDREKCTVLLREKGETFRWQPVSPTLMAGLVQHAEERNAPSDKRLLRYQDGHQITERRYDQLWVRIGRELPWFRNQGISTHWLRHTTLTWVERNFGFAVAHAYAGHPPISREQVKASSENAGRSACQGCTAVRAWPERRAARAGEPGAPCRVTVFAIARRIQPTSRPVRALLSRSQRPSARRRRAKLLFGDRCCPASGWLRAATA